MRFSSGDDGMAVIQFDFEAEKTPLDLILESPTYECTLSSLFIGNLYD
jgi:hypothetical protein